MKTILITLLTLVGTQSFASSKTVEQGIADAGLVILRAEAAQLKVAGDVHEGETLEQVLAQVDEKIAGKNVTNSCDLYTAPNTVNSVMICTLVADTVNSSVAVRYMIDVTVNSAVTGDTDDVVITPTGMGDDTVNVSRGS